MSGAFDPDKLASITKGLGESMRVRVPDLAPMGRSPVATLADIAEANYANEFCERLEAQIRAFDEELDQDHEVGVRLVSYGQTVVFHLTHLGFHNPSLIFFYGETPDGHRVQLIQHVSQISFILMAMTKPDPEQPRRPFGFAQATRESGASDPPSS